MFTMFFAIVGPNLCCRPVNNCSVLAYRQIGAFIADWGKDATFPWHGEQGISNLAKSKIRNLAFENYEDSDSMSIP